MAGAGTRFLPATKAMPKEMLTVVDKPLIQYAVEECLASGIEHLIFVTGRRKSAIEDHFDLAPELEHFLEEKGKDKDAQMVREIGGNMQFSYTRQSEALGLGHAVLCAAELVGEEPFAVLLGDVIMDGAQCRPLASFLTFTKPRDRAQSTWKKVPRERLHFYGIIDPAPAPRNGKDSRFGDRLLRVNDLVEKPSAETAPSIMAVTGRYVLPSEVFDYLRDTKPGAGGEIQLTDALRTLAKGPGLWAYIYEGKTHDAGDKMGYLKATVEIALQNPKLGKEFREYLRAQKF